MAYAIVTEYGAGADTWDDLYEGSAFTWEGLHLPDIYEAKKVADWLEHEELTKHKVVNFYKTTGAEFNRRYGLTGSNAYPDDLSIVSIDNDDLRIEKMVPIQLKFDARWFDDIVDNNLAREETA